VNGSVICLLVHDKKNVLPGSRLAGLFAGSGMADKDPDDDPRIASMSPKLIVI
jgi:hypothetical protein